MGRNMVGKFDITGIGNAIVDVIVNVEDKYLEDQDIRKGMMSLVDLKTIENISDTIEIKTTVSGGSVANSIVALAQNGMNTAFIGKVSNDEIGSKFIDGLKSENVTFACKAQSDDSKSGRCIVMVTPDAQRTMSTYLGISQKLDSGDINQDVIKNSSITYLEGYLWDLDDAQVAIKHATDYAKSSGNLVAFSVSDVFCIERFRDSFRSMIDSNVDIVFANKEEIKSLYENDNIEEITKILSQQERIYAITMGEEGALIIKGDETYKIEAQKIENLVDTTGAGDLFAAGFLEHFIKNESLESCGSRGVEMASRVIQQYGARLKT
tara:strand:- start:3396 stop:4364 length:969 start_codon:yes stop_codon:yes gene_type:complete